MLREWPYTASSQDALGNTSSSDLVNFARPRILQLSALGQSFGSRGAKSPRHGEISPRRMYFPIHPSSLQCMDTRRFKNVKFKFFKSTMLSQKYKSLPIKTGAHYDTQFLPELQVLDTLQCLLNIHIWSL